jgi:hypothetical protein
LQVPSGTIHGRDRDEIEMLRRKQPNDRVIVFTWIAVDEDVRL